MLSSSGKLAAVDIYTVHAYLLLLLDWRCILLETNPIVLVTITNSMFVYQGNASR
jgi:hypothetical protein